RVRRPVPVRPSLESLEKRTLLSFSTLSVHPPPSPTEGTPTATFTVADFTTLTNEPPKNFTGTVTWGDGSSTAFSNGNGLSKTGTTPYGVALAHPNAKKPPTATVITVSISDSSDSTSTVGSSSTFTVADAALSSVTISNPGATENHST